MLNLSCIEVSEICRHLGESNPQKIQRVFGGNIHDSWKLEFPSSCLFLKTNTRNERFLKFEQYCLNDLHKYLGTGNLITPNVIGYLEVNNIEILIMEWIDMPNSDQRKLGKGLAEMHLRSSESNPKIFGYPISGYIGTSQQIQGWDSNWVNCFIDLRLEPQLIKLNNNLLSIDLINKIKTKIKEILYEHEPHICLIHGDLWSGNMGIGQSNQGVIFDPACWWADSEADIAMTRLFGGFKNEFYEEYHKVISKKEGFENRITIYNFYHVLNHLNMFGSGYLQQAEEYIGKILKM